MDAQLVLQKACRRLQASVEREAKPILMFSAPFRLVAMSQKEDGWLYEVKWFVLRMLPRITGPAKYQLFTGKEKSDMVKISFSSLNRRK